MSSEKKTPDLQSNESRREFLRATTFAAAGIVLTPILIACGGDTAPVTPRKSGPSTKSGPSPKTNPAPAKGSSGGAELVESADAVGPRGSVKFSAVTDKPVEVKYAQVAGQTDAPIAQALNNNNGPYDDAFVAVAGGAGGKNAVADVIFVLTPAAGTKALKSTKDAKGANWDFRFTRAMTVGRERKVTYVIGDLVTHNVTVKNARNQRQVANGDGRASNNEDGSLKPLEVAVGDASSYRTEGLYEVTCSMHTWERGYLYSAPHAYVGVTGNPRDDKKLMNFIQGNVDGTVVMENVPVGEHEVKVYHEGNEVKSFKVTVTEGGVTEAPAVEL